MIVRYRAAWILPIDRPPIVNGWVAVEDGRIVDVGGQAIRRDANDVDLGDVAIMPGLVNAHTHLELSYLRGQVPPADGFVTWIRGVMSARRQRPDPRSREIVDAIDAGIRDAAAAGTAVVGDISNTLAVFGPLRASSLAAVVFYELIRFNAPDAALVATQAAADLRAAEPSGRVRASLAAHAPYSVAPSLLRAIRPALDAAMPDAPCSVHLSESTDEVEFVRTGRGAWRDLLEEIGSWDPSWTAPGVSPVRYLDDLGFLDARTVVVHGVQMTRDDLAIVAARGATLVTCPRSNRHTGAGDPPIEAFYASGVKVAVGTDSLASAPDLNVFGELAAMRALAPSVSAATLLDSATRQGARALGFGDEYGTIAPGRRARLIAVDLPSRVDDVEEYLVGGVTPDRVRWIE